MLLVALCLALVAVPLATAAQDRATISLSSAETDSTDGTATVTLAASGSNVAGYQANITFDPSVVQVQRVSGADYSDPVQNVNNEAGWVFITQSRASGMDDPQLATITFEVVGSADQRTTLSFVESDTSINDADGQHVEATLDSGSIQVGDGGMSANEGTGSPATDDDGDAPVGETANQQGAPGTDAGTTPVGDGDAGGGGGPPMPVLVGAGVALLAAGVLLGRRAS